MDCWDFSMRHVAQPLNYPVEREMDILEGLRSFYTFNKFDSSDEGMGIGAVYAVTFVL